MSLKAILFDAGNTLVFLDFTAVAAVARGEGAAADPKALAAAEAHAKRRYAAFLTAGGGHAEGWRVYMAEMLGEAGVARAGSPLGRQIVAALEAEHRRFNLWRAVPEGTREALAALRDAGFKLGVISNSEGEIAALLARVGLASFFAAVLDSAIENVRKPDPEIFRRGIERLGVVAAEALYAGDIPEVDVAGARAAGLAAALIDPFAHFADFDAAPRFTSVAALAAWVLARRNSEASESST